MEQDEFTYMNFSTYKGDTRQDHVWDPVPGESPYITMPDYELQVPASYFEYEIDNRLHTMMTFDQQFIPEDERPCPIPKNPNCSSEYWRSQADLEEHHSMHEESWKPDTLYDIYNDPSHKGKTKNNLDSDFSV